MTVSTTTTKNSYSANGTLHSFAYGFKIFADADLTVIVRSATGTETTKTLNTHYVVTNAGSDSGGNVLFKFNTGTSSDAHFSSTDHHSGRHCSAQRFYHPAMIPLPDRATAIWLSLRVVR